VARSAQDLLAYCVDYARATKGDPHEIFKKRMTRLDGVVAALRRGPRPDLVCIFGSAVTQPDLVPGDIDVFVDLSRIDEESRYAIKDHLLRIATAGGYHGNYGFFDPFVLERGRMKTRSEHDNIIDVRFCLCKKQNEMRDAATASVSLADFNRVFLKQFEHHIEHIKAAS